MVQMDYFSCEISMFKNKEKNKNELGHVVHTNSAQRSACYKLYVRVKSGISLPNEHLALDYFFVREQVMSGSLRVAHIPSSTQVADLLTKLLGRRLFTLFRDKIGVFNLMVPPSCGGILKILMVSDLFFRFNCCIIDYFYFCYNCSLFPWNFVQYIVIILLSNVHKSFCSSSICVN
nr:polyprotein [Ipomoea batatas]